MRTKTNPPTVLIAGSGRIGRAAALFLREVETATTRGAKIILGDQNLEAAESARRWLLAGSSAAATVEIVAMPNELSTDGAAPPDLERSYREADVILDCLPGHLASRLAAAALRFDCRYVNITEHVEQTSAIIGMAADTHTALLLQTGLAPGYINVLGLHLLDRFSTEHGADRLDRLAMRVGALTENAEAPHYYGFTWSDEGVATEYVVRAKALRDGVVRHLPSLSEREGLLLGGVPYEADLTSGGVANLCELLADRVTDVDYKTIRFPGHYAWVDRLLARCPEGEDRRAFLHREMIAAVPNREDDVVVLYASATGNASHDGRSRLHQLSLAKTVRPVRVGPHLLTAIQATTASALVESARLLLERDMPGVSFPSDLDRRAFLDGPFVGLVYGTV